jgi:hypothetical protein
MDGEDLTATHQVWPVGARVGGGNVWRWQLLSLMGSIASRSGIDLWTPRRRDSVGCAAAGAASSFGRAGGGGTGEAAFCCYLDFCC